jgi:hypothetical protein
VPSARVDWAPYWATGTALVLAFGLNAWTGNRLWFWYTAIGTGVFLTVIGWVRRNRPAVPPMATWMVGLAGAMHYVGGSLSGLHQVGGPNGLYFVFPWWDNVVHFVGCFALGVAALAVLEARGARPRAAFTIVEGVALASLAGVVVELYEFAQFYWLGTIDQGFYTNTVLDLYYNLLGASAGAFSYGRFAEAAKKQSDVGLPT